MNQVTSGLWVQLLALNPIGLDKSHYHYKLHLLHQKNGNNCTYKITEKLEWIKHMKYLAEVLTEEESISSLTQYYYFYFN